MIALLLLCFATVVPVLGPQTPWLTLTWHPYMDTRVNALRLERSQDGGSSWVAVTTVPRTTTRVTDASVILGEAYQYRLVALWGAPPRASAPSNLAQGVCCPTLTVAPLLIAPGGMVSVTWALIPSPSAANFITLSAVNASDRQYVIYKRPGGVAAGSMTFPLPAMLPAGPYEFRLFADDTYAWLAVSAPISVTPLPPITGFTVRFVP